MSRRSKIKFFPLKPGEPEPLCAETVRRVRFEEVDPLTIVWHGRYPSYFEDGRASFGARYEMGYLNMYKAQFMAPIAAMHIEYLEPLFFPEEFKIIARLHWTEAVKLNFSYQVENGNGKICAVGYTVQMITTLSREPMFIRPPYLEHFFKSWQEGRLP